MNIKLLTLLTLICVGFTSLESKTTRITVEGMIDNGVAYYIERGIRTATESGSDRIIFNINTFGGKVDAATEIKDDILNSGLETVAYVNKRAISAGALIALSCNKIVMAEGSSMGAATVVDQTGKKQSEKAQSYFRSEIGSTAEMNGRSKQIARAMVDEDIEIEGLVEKGKLLSLTAQEALEVGFCDTVVATDAELYSYLGIEGSEVSDVNISIAEMIVRFLTNPIVSSLLMTLAFLGLIFEVKTAGWGVGGTVGLIALVLFFGSHYIINLADHIEIIIFIVSVVLILLEVLVIPGFGVAGIMGMLGIFLSFFLTLLGSNPTGYDLINAGASLSASFILTMIGVFFMVKYLPDAKFMDFIIVKGREEKGSGVRDTRHYSELAGKTGKASTDLRLSGKVIIDDKTYQAISYSEYIDAGENIKVSKIEGNKIIVIKDKTEN